MESKKRAAVAAMAYVKDGMVVGLGTGSTSATSTKPSAPPSARASSATSRASRPASGPPTLRSSKACRSPRSPRHPQPDVTVDGADEIDPQMNLIKGLGGALLREKIVAASSKKMVVIADSSKVVSKLGTTQPLPIEVTPFGHETHVGFFRSLGAEPTLRQDKKKGGTFVTDNANYIYDVRFPNGIADAVELEKKLEEPPGHRRDRPVHRHRRGRADRGRRQGRRAHR